MLARFILLYDSFDFVRQGVVYNHVVAHSLRQLARILHNVLYALERLFVRYRRGRPYVERLVVLYRRRQHVKRRTYKVLFHKLCAVFGGMRHRVLRAFPYGPQKLFYVLGVFFNILRGSGVAGVGDFSAVHTDCGHNVALAFFRQLARRRFKGT